MATELTVATRRAIRSTIEAAEAFLELRHATGADRGDLVAAAVTADEVADLAVRHQRLVAAATRSAT